MNRSILAIGIIFLFIVLVVSPIVFGYNTILKEKEKYWEDISIILVDNPNSSNVENGSNHH